MSVREVFSRLVPLGEAGDVRVTGLIAEDLQSVSLTAPNGGAVVARVATAPFFAAQIGRALVAAAEEVMRQGRIDAIAEETGTARASAAAPVAADKKGGGR